MKSMTTHNKVEGVFCKHCHDRSSPLLTRQSRLSVVIGRASQGVPAVIHRLQQERQQELDVEHDHEHLPDHNHEHLRDHGHEHLDQDHEHYYYEKKHDDI